MATRSKSPLRSTDNEKKVGGFEQSCPQCSKPFHGQTQLRQHRTRAHKNVKCVACPGTKTFTNLGSFVRHLGKAHDIHISAAYAALYANGTAAFPDESDYEVELKCDESEMESKNAHKFNCDDCDMTLVQFANATMSAATNTKQDGQQIDNPRTTFNCELPECDKVFAEQHSERHHAENANYEISASLADDTIEATTQGHHTTEQTDEYLASVSGLNPKHQFRQENMTSAYPSEPTSLKVAEYSAFHDVPAFWLSSQVLQDADIEEEWYDPYGANLDGTDSNAMDLDDSQPFSDFLESGLRPEFN